MKTALISTAILLGATTTLAQSADLSEYAENETFSAEGYTSTDGETLYQTLCAGCHMPDGSGAVGAGAYPALAGNELLEFASYPISVIVNGKKDMPILGELLSDEQVVAIVTYIQTHLGNSYSPDATTEAVADARPIDPDDPNRAEHE